MVVGSQLVTSSNCRPIGSHQVPEGKAGWGKEGILDFAKIDALIARCRTLKGG